MCFVAIFLTVDVVVSVCPAAAQLGKERHLQVVEDRPCKGQQRHEKDLPKVEADLFDVASASQLDELLVAVVVVCLLLAVCLLPIAGALWPQRRLVAAGVHYLLLLVRPVTGHVAVVLPHWVAHVPRRVRFILVAQLVVKSGAHTLPHGHTHEGPSHIGPYLKASRPSTRDPNSRQSST